GRPPGDGAAPRVEEGARSRLRVVSSPPRRADARGAARPGAPRLAARAAGQPAVRRVAGRLPRPRPGRAAARRPPPPAAAAPQARARRVPRPPRASSAHRGWSSRRRSERRPRIAADGRVEDDAREPPDASVDAEETRTLEGAHRGLGRGVEVAGLLPVVRAGAA